MVFDKMGVRDRVVFVVLSVLWHTVPPTIAAVIVPPQYYAPAVALTFCACLTLWFVGIVIAEFIEEGHEAEEREARKRRAKRW